MTRRYPDYRAWPNCWLPEVPTHWTTGSFRHFADFTTGWTPPTGDDASYVGDNAWANIGDLKTKWISDTAKHLSDDAVEGQLPSRVGDLLFAFKLSVGAVARVASPMFTNEAIATVRSTDALDLGYGYYAIPEFLPMNSNTNIYGAPLLNASLMRSAAFAIPPLDEQRAIADHLDRETARIGTLIEEQQRLIEMLRERRQAVIESAAGRGIDAAASMKSSGLSWIDKVPDHWVVANIRRFASMKTGHTPSRSNPDYWVDCTIPWFTLADVWQLRDGKRTYLGETESKISELGLANSAADLLPAETVVLSRTASVGFTGVMPEPMATSQDFWNWVPGDQLDSVYLMWVFRAMRSEFQALMIGSTHKTIYQPTAAAIRIPVPPLDEQQRIVSYLDEQTAKIDALIAETEMFIELSRERRAALITAAVTGQIDVRGAA
jgi:restriction endonuclease S subunit